MEDRLAKLLDEKISGIQKSIMTLLEMQEQKQMNVQFREQEQTGKLEETRQSEAQLLQQGQARLEEKRRRFEAALGEAPKVHLVPHVTELIEINGIKRHLVAGLETWIEQPFADELLFRQRARLEALILERDIEIDPGKSLEEQGRELGKVVARIGGTPISVS
jgi:hypothetical protein